jgi:hypothetical protein
MKEKSTLTSNISSQEKKTWRGHGEVTAFGFAHGYLVTSGTSDSDNPQTLIKLWDPNTLELLGSLESDDQSMRITCLKELPFYEYYELCLISDMRDQSPEKGKLYIDVNNNVNSNINESIRYIVLDPLGRRQENKINRNQLGLKNEEYLGNDKLKRLLPDILEITSRRGHTLPKLLITGCVGDNGAEIKIWNMQTMREHKNFLISEGKSISNLWTHGIGSIGSAAINFMDNHKLSKKELKYNDGASIISKLITNNSKYTSNMPTHDIRALIPLPNDRLACIKHNANKEQIIIIPDLYDQNSRYITIDAHFKNIACLHLLSDGQLVSISTGSDDEAEMEFWDSETGKKTDNVSLEHGKIIDSCVSKDRVIVLYEKSPTVFVYFTNHESWTFSPDGYNDLQSVGVMSDDTLVTVSKNSGYIWDLSNVTIQYERKNEEKMGEFQIEDKERNGFAVLPNDQLMISYQNGILSTYNKLNEKEEQIKWVGKMLDDISNKQEEFSMGELEQMFKYTEKDISLFICSSYSLSCIFRKVKPELKEKIDSLISAQLDELAKVIYNPDHFFLFKYVLKHAVESGIINKERSKTIKYKAEEFRVQNNPKVRALTASVEAHDKKLDRHDRIIKTVCNDINDLKTSIQKKAKADIIRSFVHITLSIITLGIANKIFDEAINVANSAGLLKVFSSLFNVPVEVIENVAKTGEKFAENFLEESNCVSNQVTSRALTLLNKSPDAVLSWSEIPLQGVSQTVSESQSFLLPSHQSSRDPKTEPNNGIITPDSQLESQHRRRATSFSTSPVPQLQPSQGLEINTNNQNTCTKTKLSKTLEKEDSSENKSISKTVPKNILCTTDFLNEKGYQKAINSLRSGLPTAVSVNGGPLSPPNRSPSKVQKKITALTEQIENPHRSEKLNTPIHSPVGFFRQVPRSELSSESLKPLLCKSKANSSN